MSQAELVMARRHVISRGPGETADLGRHLAETVSGGTSKTQGDDDTPDNDDDGDASFNFGANVEPTDAGETP